MRIRHNKAARLPGSLVFVDTESIQEELPGRKRTVAHRLRLWTASYVRWEGGLPTRQSSAYGFESSGFWRWIKARLSRKKPIWLFAHNLPFDLSLLHWFDEVEHGEYSIRWLVNRGTTTVIRASAPAGSVVMLDTANYFRTSLAELGESIGIPKLPMPDQGAPEKDWLNYC